MQIIGRYVILLAIIFSMSELKAQRSEVDSLKELLKHATIDTVHIQILNQLSNILPEGEWEAYNDSMEVFAVEKLRGNPGEKEKSVYLSTLASAYSNRSLIFKYGGEIAKAVEFAEKSIALSDSIHDSRNKCIGLFNVGKLYNEQGNITRAILSLQASYKLAQENDYKDMQTYSLNILGYISKEQKELDKALEYHSTAYALSKKLEDKETVGFSLSCMAMVYVDQKKYDKALEAFVECQNIFRDAQNLQNVGIQYYNIGNVYEKQGKLMQALENYDKALELNVKRKDKVGMASVLNAIGSVHLASGNSTKAESFFDRGLDIARELGFPKLIYPPAEGLYRIYKGKGQADKALKMYELFVKMKDSVNNEQTRRNTIKAQFKYEMDKRVAADSVQREEDKKIMVAQLGQERTQRYALVASILLLLSVAGFIVYRLRINQRIKEMKLRNQIASDLHDDVGSALSSISLFAGVARSSGQPTLSIVEKIENTSRETIENMSDIVWSIQPKNDNIVNVLSRMKYFGSSLLGTSGIAFEFIDGPGLEHIFLDMVQRKNFYLIYKESLNNIAKYSHATKARVDIRRDGSSLVMMISDDGGGFDTTLETSGNGLKNMKQRAAEMNALIEISSIKGKGTSITLTISQ